MSSEIDSKALVCNAREDLTIRNVGKLTTFELRQELVKRNCLDIPEENINHRTMLQRLVQVLLDEENKISNEKSSSIESEKMAASNAAKLVREQKKLEAIERSKLRQNNPTYFKELAEKNVAPKKSELEDLEEFNLSNDVINSSDELDPFQSNFKPKSKIHIR
jgi:hypothetical protein